MRRDQGGAHLLPALLGLLLVVALLPLTAGDSPLTWRLSLFVHSLSCSIFFIYVCCFLGLTFIFLSLLFLLCLSSSFSGVNEPLLRVHGDLRVCILGCLLLKARARHVRAVELT